MSALVLKICSEYAKSLGLNFPPCTQQEINAICEWVDKHTIKDMTISQDGYNVTFTFKTENDTTKEFTFTIPKTVDIDELEKVLVGSDSVVVERLEDNSGLRVRLAQSVINDINNKLTKPANPSAESAVTMSADGTVGTKPLSEIGGGGGKSFMHNITIYIDVGQVQFSIIKATRDSITLSDFYGYTNRIGYDGYMSSTVGNGFIRGITIQTSENTFSINVEGILVGRANDLTALSATTYIINSFEDFVIEL